MTKAIVPFFHSLSETQAAKWRMALKAAIPEIDICEMHELSMADRAAADVAIVANLDPNDLVGMPNLKWVQSLWAGVERLLAAMPDPSVEIVRLVDPQLAETMAEAVLAWTLYLHRDMPRYAAQQKLGVWEQHDLPTAASRRIGILGLGQLGQSAAKRLVANGFDVRGWSRSAKTLDQVQTYSGAEGMAQLLAEADILIVLLPSTPATRNLLDDTAFEYLPKGARIINFARADIIDQRSLVDRLVSGRINHAVLDVFDQEPLPADDPLWSNPAVTVLPHISAPTNRHTAAALVATNLRRWFADGTMPPAVSRSNGY
ncbi:glyoxylate/hydroxypyruvate reductase A [uncultured Sulfitobacter sp.]|uniref:2-hydroxyacid dehydrogenase n=1 Tax=uncultured Sulfitobacter sp. TaxID=191468 RepID=UPI00259373E9|nr:glyoxylate/hydroxypyruvate reductase A [uncultured Sulfitobacter sp.]